MVKSSSSIIGLISVISGIHTHFLHVRGNENINVEITEGNAYAGETIKLTTSEVPDLTINVGLWGGELHCACWVLGNLMHTVKGVCDTVEERRAIKEELIAILKGTQVLE